MSLTFRIPSRVPCLCPPTSSPPFLQSFNYPLAEEDDFINIATTAALELMGETNVSLLLLLLLSLCAMGCYNFVCMKHLMVFPRWADDVIEI